MDTRPAGPVLVEKWLRLVRFMMFFQAVLGIAGAAFLLYLLGLSEGNGDDTTGYGPLRAVSVVSVLLAVLLLVCAVKLPRRLPWVRTTTLAVEGVVVAGGLVNLLLSLSSGLVEPIAIAPIALGIGVIKPLLSREMSDWFAGRGGVGRVSRSTGRAS